MRRPGGWGIELDRILERIPIVEDMRQLLETLRTAYGCHVDVELTANLRPDDSYRINLLQCRPLQVRECDAHVQAPTAVSPENLVLRERGAVLGYSRIVGIDQLIYVVPDAYGGLS
jgi:pyruvate,water dikinase